MKKIIMMCFIICVLPNISDAFSTQGFSNPYGIVVDSKTNFIYVSNVNGDSNAKDDNGFISRLKGDGTVDQLKFVDGAASDLVTLHAPKGMAVSENTLYVADIDKLRAFDLTSGKFLFDVNFGDLPVQHFYDMVIAPDSAIYLTDGPGNIIYRINIPKLHEVTTFASGEVLASPRGICWNPVRQVFLVTSSNANQVIAFNVSGKKQSIPSIILRGPEAIRADESGNVYVATPNLSAVYKLLPNFAVVSFKLGLNTPTGLAFQKDGNQILITSFAGGVVQSALVQ